ncbi:hypothetical protein NECAME_05572 [Necator americanus]|uniref:Uncharacterized protein n=1 Tax=Necator americanus TaxID=51031 RepID=W2SFU0_NECAM|nr:hypothetical protein NECAME_05572 [Necator americanus]ETN68489.1 hypothetical protein NECAME_05572 [Necator americanus]
MQEMDRMVWQMIHKHVKYIGGLIEETPFAHIFEVVRVFRIFNAHFFFGLMIVLDGIATLQGRLPKKDCRPPPELLGVVLDEGVRQGGTAAWDRVYAAYLETKNPTERVQLIGALASTKQQSLISK